MPVDLSIGIKSPLWGLRGAEAITCDSGWLFSWIAVVLTPQSSHPYLISTEDGGLQNLLSKVTIMSNLIIASKEIRQLDGLFNLNDVHKAAGAENKHKPALFLRLEQTKELIKEISRYTDLYTENSQCSDLSIENHSKEPVITQRGGKYSGTYACKQLVIAYAAWINAKIHLETINAFLEKHDSNNQQPEQKALPDPVEKHYWLTLNSAGNVVQQIEITSASDIAEQIDTYFADTKVINRVPALKDLQEVIISASVAQSQIQEQLRLLMTSLGTPTNPSQEQVNEFWAGRDSRINIEARKRMKNWKAA